MKLRGKYRDFPYTSCPHTCIASLIINITYWNGTFYLHWHILITQSQCVTLGYTLDIVHSMDLDKCIMTYIHPCNLQSIFTALKICALFIHLSPSSQTLANTDIFTVFTIVLFPECHIVGIYCLEPLRLASFT